MTTESRQAVHFKAQDDQLAQMSSRFERFLKTHLKKIVLLVVAILLGIGSLLLVSNRSKNTNLQASELLFALQKEWDKMPKTANSDINQVQNQADQEKQDKDDLPYSTQDEWQKAVTQKIDAIAQKYPKSDVADYTKLYIAQMAMQQKDYAKAEKQYRDFLKNVGDPNLSMMVQFSLAQALLSQDRKDDALAIYLPISQKTYKDTQGKTFATLQAKNAMIEMAAIYEDQKKVKDALSLYKKVVDDGSAQDSQIVIKAQERLRAIDVK